MRHHIHIIWVTFKHEKDETPLTLNWVPTTQKKL
jgi:hypothetical protein